MGAEVAETADSVSARARDTSRRSESDSEWKRLREVRGSRFTGTRSAPAPPAATSSSQRAPWSGVTRTRRSAPRPSRRRPDYPRSLAT
ncbi:hypothetical protein UO65_3974 [Actinokineospora spheciospongiae]|uniref:Uncharacterized protein n=1 Tax=Actinokineospora spheciospongiae TaxID=909613 RepID=W7IW65_9PSEU|nr:hypothetical protein UO65_3974 [Actinokineospora spheciospongiae]